MRKTSVTFRNGRIFDGKCLHEGQGVHFKDGRFDGFRPEAELIQSKQDIDLGGDILFPGFVDLQVNGGDGILFNADPSTETLRRIANAHRRLGVTAFLPTLISDTRDKTCAAIAAVVEAISDGIPGVAGLHLEGPHLSTQRKGAHDATLIRKMETEDFEILLAAVEVLPLLKVTIAPESVTESQVSALASAGVLVSLGHSDADSATCLRFITAGARCVTHLFNGMSQLGNRNPGLVGAALSRAEVHAGLIADAVHVHPDTMRAAWNAKIGPGKIFLVSDAMAVAGTDATEFELGGRLIRRHEGALKLSDGTLAGADLDLATAVQVMVNEVGVDFAEALKAATLIPATMIGHDYRFDWISDVVRLSVDTGCVKPTTSIN